MLAVKDVINKSFPTGILATPSLVPLHNSTLFWLLWNGKNYHIMSCFLFSRSASLTASKVWLYQLKGRKEMSVPGLKYHARHKSQCQRRTAFPMSQFWDYLNLKDFPLFTMNLKVLPIPLNDNLYSLKVLSPRYFYWQRLAKLKFDYDMYKLSHHSKI